MFASLSRDQVQLISFVLFSAGAFVIICGGWNNEGTRAIGITLMAGSIWFIMMCESILLAKVQNEMHSVLEALSKKRELEVQDLIGFLKQKMIETSPLESWDGAKQFLSRIQFPAMVITSNHQIVKANNLMTDLLGYDKDKLNGTPAYMINLPILMSKIGELCAKPPHVNKSSMHTRYAYLHKSGKTITGGMDATLMVDGGFFVVFHPDDNDVIGFKELDEYI